MRRRRGVRRKLGQGHEQLADGVSALDGMAEWNIGMDLLRVAPANPGSGDVAFSDQVSDDTLRGPLRDADCAAMSLPRIPASSAVQTRRCPWLVRKGHVGSAAPSLIGPPRCSPDS